MFEAWKPETEEEKTEVRMLTDVEEARKKIQLLRQTITNISKKRNNPNGAGTLRKAQYEAPDQIRKAFEALEFARKQQKSEFQSLLKHYEDLYTYMET